MTHVSKDTLNPELLASLADNALWHGLPESAYKAITANFAEYRMLTASDKITVSFRLLRTITDTVAYGHYSNTLINQIEALVNDLLYTLAKYPIYDKINRRNQLVVWRNSTMPDLQDWRDNVEAHLTKSRATMTNDNFTGWSHEDDPEIVTIAANDLRERLTESEIAQLINVLATEPRNMMTIYLENSTFLTKWEINALLSDIGENFNPTEIEGLIALLEGQALCPLERHWFERD